MIQDDLRTVREALDRVGASQTNCDDYQKKLNATAALSRLASFFELETGFDVKDPKLNAARYDGFLDGVSVGMDSAIPGKVDLSGMKKQSAHSDFNNEINGWNAALVAAQKMIDGEV